jgi:protein TonB
VQKAQMQERHTGAVVVPLRPTIYAPLYHGPGAGMLDIAPPEVLPRDLPRKSGWAGAAVSFAVHASALASLWIGLWTIEPNGGGGQHLEAISVSFVPSQVLEAPERKAPALTGGSINNPAPAEGTPEPPKQIAQPQSPEVEQQSTQVEPPPPKQDDDALRIERKPQKQEIAAQAAGGATARTLTEFANTAAAAGASPGEVSRYAAAVRTALARSRPNGLRQKGVLTITFGIGENGEVRFARLSESSGHASLDDATIAAVRHTIFPRPPTTMTADQLTYVVPFRFK